MIKSLRWGLVSVLILSVATFSWDWHREYVRSIKAEQDRIMAERIEYLDTFKQVWPTNIVQLSLGEHWVSKALTRQQSNIVILNREVIDYWNDIQRLERGSNAQEEKCAEMTYRYFGMVSNLNRLDGLYDRAILLAEKAGYQTNFTRDIKVRPIVLPHLP